MWKPVFCDGRPLLRGVQVAPATLKATAAGMRITHSGAAPKARRRHSLRALSRPRLETGIQRKEPNANPRVRGSDGVDSSPTMSIAAASFNRTRLDAASQIRLRV